MIFFWDPFELHSCSCMGMNFGTVVLIAESWIIHWCPRHIQVQERYISGWSLLHIATLQSDISEATCIPSHIKASESARQKIRFPSLLCTILWNLLWNSPWCICSPLMQWKYPRRRRQANSNVKWSFMLGSYLMLSFHGSKKLSTWGIPSPLTRVTMCTFFVDPFARSVLFLWSMNRESEYASTDRSNSSLSWQPNELTVTSWEQALPLLHAFTQCHAHESLPVQLTHDMIHQPPFHPRGNEDMDTQVFTSLAGRDWFQGKHTLCCRNDVVDVFGDGDHFTASSMCGERTRM